MKSDKVMITITETMLLQYETIFGKQAKLPATFPMIFYKYITVPWEYEAAPILRKQSCQLHDELVIGENYLCYVTLDRKVQRGNHIFYVESLVGNNQDGEEAFKCVSELVVQLK